MIREVPVDQKSADIKPSYKRGRKEDAGNSRPVSVVLVPGEVMEQIILSAVMQTARIGHNQHRFTKGRSCLTNLLFFC